MRAAAASVILLLTWASPARAYFYTGNEVFSYCSSNKSFVAGFVAGAFDKAEVDSGAFFSYAVETPSTGVAFGDTFVKYSNQVQEYCAPKGVVLQQVIDVYCQYLGATPGERHLSAALLLNNALTKAWSCAAAPAPTKSKR